MGALHDERHAAAASEELMRIYWPPVYAYLRQCGYGRDSAAELTQSFFYKKVLNGQLFERYEESKGRLRSLILTSLKNHIIDEHRSEVSRGKHAVIDINVDEFGGAEQADIPPELAFERRWATAQLKEAVSRCEAYFLAAGRKGHWDAFTDRVYHPVVHSTTPTPLAELAPRLGFRTPADAAAAVQLVKRRIVTFLREVVIDSALNPSEAEEEYGRLLVQLGTKDS